MRRRSFVAGTLTVALAGAVAVAPAGAAEQPAPAPSARAAGLLDGLGTTLGGTLGALLGTGQQQQLQQLLSQLQGGQPPTGTLLAPITSLLGQVARTPGLPAGTQSLVQQLADLLGTASADEPLGAAIRVPVADLLRQLGGTSGVPASVSTLLTQLADALVGRDGLTSLPGVVLSLPPQLTDDLNALLQQLESGRTPTGTLLAPVVSLLRQVTDTPGLPADLSSLVGSLGDTLANTTGALDPLLTSQLSTVLSLVAGTPGVSTETRTTIERISTILQQQATAAGASGASTVAGAKARAATKRDRAVVKRVRVNAARTRIGIRVACPSSSPTTCATIVRARFAGRKAAQGKRVRIGAGRSKVVRLRMLPIPRAASMRSGGKLGVVVTTTFGTRSFSSSKTVTLRARPRR